MAEGVEKQSTEEKEEQSPEDETPAGGTGDENQTDFADEETATEKINESPSDSKEDNEAPQEIAKEEPEIKLETAPADYRFPTTNQTRHCFTRYIEYHRCIAAKGKGAPECQKFAKYYRSLCPAEWIERWNEQRENGTFPGPL